MMYMKKTKREEAGNQKEKSRRDKEKGKWEDYVELEAYISILVQSVTDTGTSLRSLSFFE